MSEHIEVIIRSIISFSILLFGTKILGKQTISQMTLFDFVATISMGAISANLAFNTSIKIHHTIIAFTIYTLILLIIAKASLNNRKARKFFAGDPTVVIQNGEILEKNMKKMRYTLDYLNQQLREKDVFNIQDVLFALVETNGTLTVLKKPSLRNVIRQDLDIHVDPENRLPIELIMDRQLIKENLEDNNIDVNWLNSELKNRQLKVEDVLYAVLSSNDYLYINTYDNQVDYPIDKEWK